MRSSLNSGVADSAVNVANYEVETIHNLQEKINNTPAKTKEEQDAYKIMNNMLAHYEKSLNYARDGIKAADYEMQNESVTELTTARKYMEQLTAFLAPK